MGGIKINSRNTLKYFGLKFIMKKKIFVIDVNDRIWKFNAASHDVLLNADGLCETVKCEIIDKKCLPVLMYRAGASNLKDAIYILYKRLYKMYIAYKKIFRCIFRLPT